MTTAEMLREAIAALEYRVEIDRVLRDSGVPTDEETDAGPLGLPACVARLQRERADLARVMGVTTPGWAGVRYHAALHRAPSDVFLELRTKLEDAIKAHARSEPHPGGLARFLQRVRLELEQVRAEARETAATSVAAINIAIAERDDARAELAQCRERLAARANDLKVIDAMRALIGAPAFAADDARDAKTRPIDNDALAADLAEHGR